MSNAVQSAPRIALVHDWLIGISGTERVLKALHESFPEAPIYTLIHRPGFTRSFLPSAEIHASFLQSAYERLGHHRWLAPFFSSAAESFDLSEYDIVISSSSAYTKGLIVRPHTIHINYCYSPTRQLWDWQSEYQREPRRVPRIITRLSQHLGRLWDFAASERVDHYIAISETVQQRITKYYRRKSELIYPPVNLASMTELRRPTRQEYFLIVSRLFKHKNVDIAVQTFNRMGWNLVIIGAGPELSRLRRLAGPTVTLLGYQPDSIVRHYYAHCQAFIMPQEEDFGLTPIEAMSYGKPVLALRRGAALEYIQEGINGEFFDDPLEEVLAYGLKRLNDKLKIHSYDSETIKKSAQRFSAERFKKEIGDFVKQKAELRNQQWPVARDASTTVQGLL